MKKILLLFGFFIFFFSNTFVITALADKYSATVTFSNVGAKETCIPAVKHDQPGDLDKPEFCIGATSGITNGVSMYCSDNKPYLTFYWKTIPGAKQYTLKYYVQYNQPTSSYIEVVIPAAFGSNDVGLVTIPDKNPDHAFVNKPLIRASIKADSGQYSTGEIQVSNASCPATTIGVALAGASSSPVSASKPTPTFTPSPTPAIHDESRKIYPINTPTPTFVPTYNPNIKASDVKDQQIGNTYCDSHTISLHLDGNKYTSDAHTAYVYGQRSQAYCIYDPSYCHNTYSDTAYHYDSRGNAYCAQANGTTLGTCCVADVLTQQSPAPAVSADREASNPCEQASSIGPTCGGTAGVKGYKNTLYDCEMKNGQKITANKSTCQFCQVNDGTADSCINADTCGDTNQGICIYGGENSAVDRSNISTINPSKACTSIHSPFTYCQNISSFDCSSLTKNNSTFANYTQPLGEGSHKCTANGYSGNDRDNYFKCCAPKPLVQQQTIQPNPSPIPRDACLGPLPPVYAKPALINNGGKDPASGLVEARDFPKNGNINDRFAWANANPQYGGDVKAWCQGKIVRAYVKWKDAYDAGISQQKYNVKIFDPDSTKPDKTIMDVNSGSCTTTKNGQQVNKGITSTIITLPDELKGKVLGVKIGNGFNEYGYPPAFFAVPDCTKSPESTSTTDSSTSNTNSNSSSTNQSTGTGGGSGGGGGKVKVLGAFDVRLGSYPSPTVNTFIDTITNIFLFKNTILRILFPTSLM